MSKDRPSNELDQLDDDSERELLIFQAKLCEQAGRFEDMIETMKKLCQTYNDLSNHERDLLSCAYKNIIGSRRTSWRILNEILLACNDAMGAKTSDAFAPDDSGQQQQNEIASKIDHINDNYNNLNNFKKPETIYNAAIVKDILEEIEVELRTHCCNIIEILNGRLIPFNSATGESRVFYYKMKGDYLRYLCEISPEVERKEKSNESMLAYKIASDKAMVDLPPTHPVRLGLMLNISVFYYDILKSPERSCRLAKQAFDDAIAELDTLSEESYRDSTIIMQLLRDNLNLWEHEQDMQTVNEAT